MLDSEKLGYQATPITMTKVRCESVDSPVAITEWCLIEVLVQSADSHTGFVVHSIAAQVIVVQHCLVSLANYDHVAIGYSMIGMPGINTLIAS